MKKTAQSSTDQVADQAAPADYTPSMDNAMTVVEELIGDDTLMFGIVDDKLCVSVGGRYFEVPAAASASRADIEAVVAA